MDNESIMSLLTVLYNENDFKSMAEISETITWLAGSLSLS